MDKYCKWNFGDVYTHTKSIERFERTAGDCAALFSGKGFDLSSYSKRRRLNDGISFLEKEVLSCIITCRGMTEGQLANYCLGTRLMLSETAVMEVVEELFNKGLITKTIIEIDESDCNDSNKKYLYHAPTGEGFKEGKRLLPLTEKGRLTGRAESTEDMLKNILCNGIVQSLLGDGVIPDYFSFYNSVMINRKERVDFTLYTRIDGVDYYYEIVDEDNYSKGKLKKKLRTIEESLVFAPEKINLVLVCKNESHAQSVNKYCYKYFKSQKINLNLKTIDDYIKKELKLFVRPFRNAG